MCSSPLIPPHGGYRELKSYQMAEIIYDATVLFCDRFIEKRSRTHDQMVQAARSGKQNITEGSMVGPTSPVALFVVSILVNVGMYFERYVIVVTSLHRDFLPSSWGMYHFTFWDYAILIGSFGLFFTLFLLFVRVLPVVAISEVKGVMDPRVARSASPAPLSARPQEA